MQEVCMRDLIAPNLPLRYVSLQHIRLLDIRSWDVSVKYLCVGFPGV